MTAGDRSFPSVLARTWHAALFGGRRAGAAAYREAAEITNPDQAVSSEPHRSNPELEAMRKAVFTALEIRDEADVLGGLDCGELEARALHGRRARAAAPPDVSTRLRLAAQAEADAWQQAVGARTRHDHTATASKPTTPATSNGPPTPAISGTRPGKPRPNCHDEGKPSQMPEP